MTELNASRPRQARWCCPRPDRCRAGRVEAKGYRVVAFDMRLPARELLTAHYAEHAGKPFYEPLLAFMSSGPVAAIVVEGNRVIEGFRSLAGATEPTVAAPGTIAVTSVGTGVWPSRRTSFTDRTRSSRPPAKSHCGSRDFA